MYLIDLSVGYLVVNGFPHKCFGPFPSLDTAHDWYNRHDPGDWKGVISVICDPALTEDK